MSQQKAVLIVIVNHCYRKNKEMKTGAVNMNMWPYSSSLRRVHEALKATCGKFSLSCRGLRDVTNGRQRVVAHVDRKSVV